MRPIELIVEGFTSFRSRQVLDFSSLDLFAITGATGAGKTSLLDAITFALYDKVAQKPNSSRELVSQGAAQLKVEFRFLMRQTEYRAVRTWRNRGKTDVKNFLLEQLINEEWDRCPTQKIEEILGMDFETFTRVIILPQGQFDEFLKGEANKRREILRQLAGFQIFEQMRKEASDRTSRFKAEREGLEKVLAGMQAPTLEEVRERQSELEQLEIGIPELDAKVSNGRKLLESEQRLFEQIQQYCTISKHLEQLQQNANTIKVREAQLRNAQLANSIVGTWTLFQTANKRADITLIELTTANQNLSKAKLDLEQQKENYEQFRNNHLEAQKQIEAQERNLALAESLYIQQQQAEAELERAKQNMAERSQVLKQSRQGLTQAEREFHDTERQLQKIETEISNGDRDSLRLTSLRQIAEPLAEWQLRQDNLGKQQQKLQLLQGENHKLTQQLERIHQAIANADHELQAVSDRLSTAEASNLEALQSNHINALRAELHDGDQCPVCNNLFRLEDVIERHEMELIDTTAAIAQKDLAERQLVKLNEDRVKVTTSLESLHQQQREQEREITELEVQIRQVQSQIDHLFPTPWQAADILRERQALENKETTYQKLITAQTEIAIAHQTNENNLKALRATQQLAQSEYNKAELERSLRQSQLQEIQQRLQALTHGQSYTALQQLVLQSKRELSDRLQTIETSYQQARESFAKREETATKAQENYHSVISERSQHEITWQTELKSINLSESEFLAAQATRSQIEAWQKEIDNYQRQQQDLTTRGQILAETIGDRHTDEQAIGTQSKALQQLELELKEASEHRASLKAWLEQAQHKRQESQELETRKISLQAQEQTFYTLAQDLKSDKFQEYILDSLQQELANRASILLQQLSDNRYILQIESGDYWVSDNWNGGEKRRIRTLSGGETFAASLAMALALSEKLSMGIELGSLFLDEGFGTLDSETLESVTQILESLRQQERLIGVITHIQSLADRLPTQIHVRKSPNGSELVMI
ncbi:AAA family ATPase [Pseudanabaena sp. UWO310]|uniref:SbcC/MukB-like Walker B domain-containing protein n=1 Tax=Pseudanabaena sp. UWO310 TaxID=2480795 RepID=UPI001159EEDB|nr:SMC family ATPase [Pseudanabaena sp. UWO310]TYQ26758.1 SMC family ATPase [Pseudanabaena sp. UWO310]